jgi:hypothetical protein
VGELAALYIDGRAFLAAWIVTPLIVGALGARWAVRAEPALQPTMPEFASSRRATAALVLALGLFTAFFLAYVHLVYSQEEFVGRDYGQLTAFRFLYMPIRATTGRFFPLAFQEYNFLSLIARTPLVYHSFSILQLVVLLACVFVILTDVPRW